MQLPCLVFVLSTYEQTACRSSAGSQGGVLVFVYDMFSFAGPVLLQQLLQSLEDRSNVGALPLPRRSCLLRR